MTMTTDTDTDTVAEDEEFETLPVYFPDRDVVRKLAQRVIDAFDGAARLAEVESCAHNEDWPEIRDLEEWQIEELFEEVRDEIAFRGNGIRR